MPARSIPRSALAFILSFQHSRTVASGSSPGQSTASDGERGAPGRIRTLDPQFRSLALLDCAGSAPSSWAGTSSRNSPRLSAVLTNGASGRTPDPQLSTLRVVHRLHVALRRHHRRRRDLSGRIGAAAGPLHGDQHRVGDAPARSRTPRKPCAGGRARPLPQLSDLGVVRGPPCRSPWLNPSEAGCAGRR